MKPSNKERLKNCPRPHVFIRVKGGQRGTPTYYQCMKCSGLVTVELKDWYLQGLQDGRGLRIRENKDLLREARNVTNSKEFDEEINKTKKWMQKVKEGDI